MSITVVEPYENILTHILSEKFLSLGLSSINNSNFEIVLSDGIQLLVLSTEPRYQPALSMTIINRNATRFEFGTVKKIISPNLFESDLHVLKAIKLQYIAFLNEGRRDDAESHLTNYVTTAITQAIDFLSDNWERIFEIPPSYAAEYESQEKKILSCFGVIY